ncbi:hypothetical protein EKE94_06680 [Mesobaculum littorinae]|uniref:Uncharacterized protein n=1 Tax=Mesobaculum littorinae TaxID=2486419 RepID=A0A438AJ09_9RHOB|nr:hypothetical protein [Mesobaculum littorinae]RVV98595.1 hypothetical protein EKE94_06680 [Mesobaculum littorinae]
MSRLIFAVFCLAALLAAVLVVVEILRAATRQGRSATRPDSRSDARSVSPIDAPGGGIMQKTAFALLVALVFYVSVAGG